MTEKGLRFVGGGPSLPCFAMSSVVSTFSEAYERKPSVLARAPGRIEVIGNHTDYNGGLVLGAAIDRHIEVAIAPRKDTMLRLKSAQKHGFVEADLLDIQPFRDHRAWVNYPLGVIQILRERGYAMESGADFLIGGNLPLGAGLSSSAALTVSTALAVCALLGQEVSRKELVKVCQEAEHRFAGVPVGILDQGTVLHAKADQLVRIDCYLEDYTTCQIPGEVRLWVFETGVKHSLVDSLYATRREECESAFGKLRKLYPETKCLAHLDPEQVQEGKTDLTETEFKRAGHVVDETARVRTMEQAMRESDLATAGQLLEASHQSSRLLFENSTPELDALVDLLMANEQVLGARLTGGGFGGAVMAMTRPGFSEEDAAAIKEAYSGKFKLTPTSYSFKVGAGAEAKVL